MTIHTSYRLYQLFLLKTTANLHPSIYTPTTKEIANVNIWFNAINRRIEQADNDYLSLIRKRCEKVPGFFGWLPKNECILKPDPTDERWNSPFKELKCWDRKSFLENQVTGISFGKFDIVRMLPLPHSYWTNIYKTLVLKPLNRPEYPIFTEVLSIPAQRIKSYEDRSVGRNGSVTNESDLASDNKFPYICFIFLKLPKNIKNISRTEKLHQFIAEIENEINSQPIANRTELFLTHSIQYPLLIKGEFISLEQLGIFTNILRCLADDTSTIISINPEHGFDKKPDTVNFALLIKLENQRSTKDLLDTKQKVKNYLTETVKVGEKDIEFLNRGYYWNLKVRLITNNIKELCSAVVNRIRSIEAVQKVVTIPYWTITDGSNYKSPWEIEAQSKELHRDPIPHQWIGAITKIPKAKIVDGKSSSYDIFNIRLYNLKFDLEWLYGYLQRMFEAWKAEELDTDVITFQELDGWAVHCLKRLNKLIDLSESFFILEKFGRQSEELNHDNELNEMWEDLRKSSQEVANIKYLTSTILANFNEKLEGKQLVTASEPYVRFGERSEIFDQICYAMDNLFKDYCGKLKAHWKGLVLPSFEIDFAIHPRTRILYLPMDIKVHVHDKLLPISHEAAHFILKLVSENIEKDASDDFYSEIWEPIHIRARSFIKELKDHNLHSNVQNNEPKILNEKIDSILNEVENDLVTGLNDKRYTKSEVLCDIFAGISGGPGYFRSLGLNGFLPTTDFETKLYPPTWLRIYLGLELFVNNFIPCADVWVERIKPAFDSMVEKHMNVDTQKRIIKCDFKKQERFVKRSIFPSLISSKDNKHISLLTNYNFYLIKAILSDKKYIKKILQWAKDYLGDEYLFFQWSKDKTKEALEEDSKDEYYKCEEIAKKLIYDDLLIENESPKMIAASSVLLPIKRPVYPSGRILHSLFYSD